MTDPTSWLILEYTMDGRVLAYLIAISIGTGLLFGMAPALQLSRLDINAPLKDGGRGATGGARVKYLSALLVTGEMALAVVLLAGAGVMIRSFLRIHTANIGVDTTNVLTGSVDLLARYPRAEDKDSFYERLVKRLEALPGVESVAMAESLPSWNVPKRVYELAGDPEFDPQRRSTLAIMKISQAYFRTMRAPLLAGREFNDADTAVSVPVAIVNGLLAAKFWPNEDAIGKRLRFWDGDAPESWLTVVGVVSNILQDDDTRQKIDPVVYVPYRQQPGGGVWMLARTRVSPSSLANAFRGEVQALDADLPVYGPFALTDRLERYWDSRFYGSLFLIFAAIALLLASSGLYSVVAHSIRQRTQEIGIRMAMGATTRDVLELVLKQGMLPLGMGLIIGLAASLAVNRLLAAELVQISPSDPLALAAASATLVVSAALGCLIPARRAMRVDPVVALRHE
jgi:predicted permease